MKMLQASEASEAREDMKTNKELKHELVPLHEVLSGEEAEALLEKYNIGRGQMAKIFIDDPALKGLKVKAGDVVKITRNEPVVGVSTAYRVVSER